MDTSNEPQSYEDKETRLDEILTKLDNSETPIDQLAAEAKEAARLIMSMHSTLRAAKQEIAEVFAEMEKQKEAMGISGKGDL